MSSSLAQKKCIPCEKDTPPIEGKELLKITKELGGNWQVINDHHIEKEFTFKSFKEALEFTMRVGTLAEEEGHHPDIHLSWGHVRILIWTHKINGLSEADFVLAAKIDQINP